MTKIIFKIYSINYSMNTIYAEDDKRKDKEELCTTLRAVGSPPRVLVVVPNQFKKTWALTLTLKPAMNDLTLEGQMSLMIERLPISLIGTMSSFFFELTPNKNLHAHAIMEQTKDYDFVLRIVNLFRKNKTYGFIHKKELKTIKDIERWKQYITKDVVYTTSVIGLPHMIDKFKLCGCNRSLKCSPYISLLSDL